MGGFGIGGRGGYNQALEKGGGGQAEVLGVKDIIVWLWEYEQRGI